VSPSPAPVAALAFAFALAVVACTPAAAPAAHPVDPIHVTPPPTPAPFATIRGATHVTFPSRDGDLTTTQVPTTIDGYLMVPDGAGPHAAVIVLHGCGGLFARTGELTARHRDWAERLVAEGYVVLLPDSFTPRHVDEVCSRDPPPVRPADERARDVYGAFEFLANRADVDPARIAVLGWSNGGSTVLAAISAHSHARPPNLAHELRIAIAFYPGCKRVLERADWLPTTAPLHVLIGASDNWTPAVSCQNLVDTARAAGAVADIVVYPGAYHDFDAPDQKLHVRHDVATTASHTATVGTDPAARADAIERVTKWLREALR
jgi:dienelactone hydrolase